MKRDRKGAAADQVLAVLQSLGKADDHRHIAIRTDELVERAKVDRHNLARIVQPLIDAGQVLVCKITTPGVTRGTPQNEYRLATMAQGSFVPLNTKRAGIAHGAPTRPLPITTPAPKVSTPRPGVNEIEVPVLGRAQPAVASNSGSSATGSPTTTPSPGVPAVAAKATPEPSASVTLKKEHTVRKAPAGDVRCSIDDEGTVIISTDEAVIELGIDCAMRVGDFFQATEGVWRP